jgi:hypothetical protein
MWTPNFSNQYIKAIFIPTVVANRELPGCAHKPVVTKEIVKRNLQEVLGFHKLSLK